MNSLATGIRYVTSSSPMLSTCGGRLVAATWPMGHRARGHADVFGRSTRLKSWSGLSHLMPDIFAGSVREARIRTNPGAYWQFSVRNRLRNCRK